MGFFSPVRCRNGEDQDNETSACQHGKRRKAGKKNTRAHTHAHAHAHARSHTLARAHTRPPAQARKHARARTHTHTYAQCESKYVMIVDLAMRVCGGLGVGWLWPWAFSGWVCVVHACVGGSLLLCACVCVCAEGKATSSDQSCVHLAGLDSIGNKRREGGSCVKVKRRSVCHHVPDIGNGTGANEMGKGAALCEAPPSDPTRSMGKNQVHLNRFEEGGFSSTPCHPTPKAFPDSPPVPLTQPCGLFVPCLGSAHTQPGFKGLLSDRRSRLRVRSLTLPQNSSTKNTRGRKRLAEPLCKI